MEEYKSRLSTYLSDMVREELEKYDGGYTDEWNDQRKKNAEVLGYKLHGKSDIKEGATEFWMDMFRPGPIPKKYINQLIKKKGELPSKSHIKKIYRDNGNPSSSQLAKTWKQLQKEKYVRAASGMWRWNADFTGWESIHEELQNSQGEQTDFKKGDLVKDINPDCPHHGSEGKVTKVGKGTITFDVTNNGRTYKEGDELEKTVDQMVKLKESVNEAVKEIQLKEKIFEPAKWWKSDPEELLRHVYWLKGQMAPSDNKKRAQAYKDIATQLNKKYRAPKKDFQRHFSYDESVNESVDFIPTMKKLAKSLGIKSVSQYFAGKGSLSYFLDDEREAKKLEKFLGRTFRRVRLIKLDKSKGDTANFVVAADVKGIVESVNEGKWSKIMRSVRKGSKAGPWSIVVYDKRERKVKHQRLVKILQQIPAHYEDVKKKYPRDKIGIEDKYGARVYTESVNETSERDYKAEYKKYGSSTKAKKYRAELNQYNRKKGTYGNGDGKDASHKGGKIAGFEKESTNRGRREKSRLKKEDIREFSGDQGIHVYLGGIVSALHKSGIKPKTAKQMKHGFSKSRDKIGFFIDVLDRKKEKYTLQLEIDRDGNLWYLSAPRDMKLGKWADESKIVRSLKAISKLPDFGQSSLKRR